MRLVAESRRDIGVRLVLGARPAQIVGLVLSDASRLLLLGATAQWTAARASTYVTEGIDRLSAVPGVRAAAFARVRPINSGDSRMSVTVPGYTPQPLEDMEINYNSVTGAYFDAMGIRLRDGAVLATRQAPIPAVAAPTGPNQRAPLPLLQAVVNDTMARRYWPNARAVGQRFYLGDIGGTGQPVEVIGLVADVKYREVREEPRPSFYLPLAPGQALDGVFHVRIAGPLTGHLPSLRQTLTDLAPGVPITQVRTLRSQPRFARRAC